MIGCSTTKIPDVAIYKDLPFSGKCLEVWTISDTVTLTTPERCKEIKESALLITPESWAKIKLAWISACLKAGQKCEHEISTIDNFINSIQEIIASALKRRQNQSNVKK